MWHADMRQAQLKDRYISAKFRMSYTDATEVLSVALPFGSVLQDDTLSSSGSETEIFYLGLLATEMLWLRFFFYLCVCLIWVFFVSFNMFGRRFCNSNGCLGS